MAKIYPVKDSVNFAARWTVPGHKESRKSTGIATKRLAQIRANEMEREDIEAKRLAAIGIVTFDEMLAWDIARAQFEKTKPEEVKTWRTHWKHIKSFFKCATEVNANSVKAYVAYRRGQLIRGTRVPSNLSLRKEVRVLQRGIKLAKENKRAHGLDTDFDAWPKLPAEAGAKLRTQVAKARHTREEIARFIATLEGEAQAEAVLALLTGMRSGELQRCTLQMLEHQEGVTIFNVPGRKKGGSLRAIAITPFVKGLMQRYLPFKHDHKRARQYAAKRAELSDWLHPPHLRNLRGLFVSVAHEGRFSDSVIKTVAAHGETKDSHHLYVGLTNQTMLEIATYVENYWAPKLAAAFRELSKHL